MPCSGAPIPITTFQRGIIFWFLTFCRMETFTASVNFHTFPAIHTVFLFSFSLQQAASSDFLANETDKLSLLGFKSQISEDPSRFFASWNDSVRFYQWTGVKYGLRHGRVIRLNLEGMRLAGEIPVNLSHCVNLNNLVLDHNTLMGKIPYQVGSLKKLVKLSLRNNNLTGLFPGSVGNLTSLEELYLSYNNLEGQVPTSIAQLTKLRLLGLSVNSLFGEFPPPLYNLSSLIPRTRGKCLALGENYLKGNSLQATIPNLKDLSNLQSVDLSQYKLSGPIPHFIASLTSLLYLNLSVINLDGEVPVTGVFSNLSVNGLNRNS
uniref:Leucine-rich repeat-containing N-terminal plant-type domain-containing protein n=1 Tax=Solanum lycopersicum TaxID=4081 RepID=K4CUC3_SOLLC